MNDVGEIGGEREVNNLSANDLEKLHCWMMHPELPTVLP